jgi:hypothetical protein
VSHVALAALRAGGPLDPWTAIGFTADDAGAIAFANGALLLDPDLPPGLHGLVVDGIDDPAGDLEGIPLSTGRPPAPTDHPNGACELDHVVVVTDDLLRTSDAVAAVLGLERRRIRETDTVRQAFHRFADVGTTRGCIVEVVENGRVDRPALWGVVVNVVDLDAFVAHHGPDLVSPPKPAVQPGRGIATIRSGAGLGVPVAVMSA